MDYGLYRYRRSGVSVVTRFDGHMFKLGDGREAIIRFEH